VLGPTLRVIGVGPPPSYGRPVKAVRRGFGWAILVAAASCRKPPAPAATDAGSAPVVASAAAAGSSSPDRAWAEARSGDPLELARLADLEGVDALAEVALDEHASLDDRATAIRALMFVDDPSPAVEALAKLVSDPSVERSTLALQTLAAVAPKRMAVEELEPGAWRVAGEALLRALGTIQGPVRRELAIRTLVSLADRGAVARSAIPAR